MHYNIQNLKPNHQLVKKQFPSLVFLERLPDINGCNWGTERHKTTKNT